MTMNSIAHPPAGARGIGLIEVMVTVVIIALGVVALGRMMLTTTQEAGYSKARAEALAWRTLR